MSDRAAMFGRMRIAIVVGATLAVARGSAAEPPVVSPAEIARTVATAKVDPKAPTGSARLVAHIDQAAPAADVRAALAAARLPVIEEITGPSSVVFVVEAASGARAVIRLGERGGEISIVARPTAIKLRGRCVAIPGVTHEVEVESSRIDHDGMFRRTARRSILSTARWFDVDGDAIPDAFVPVPASPHTCPEELAWRVLVVRGGCGYDLGVVGPGSAMPVDTGATLGRSPARALEVTSVTARLGPDRIPERTTTTRRFEVRKGRYRQVGKTRNGGVCHHCATWTCRAP